MIPWVAGGERERERGREKEGGREREREREGGRERGRERERGESKVFIIGVGKSVISE